MTLSNDNLIHLCNKAITAATEAGAVIASFTNKNIAVNNKIGGDTLASQVVTEVDILSQKTILKTLKPTCSTFDLALLTEESTDDRSRFDKDYFWCIDPLDGTLPFVESKNGYSVSIALVSKGGEPVIGVVYDPKTRTLYHAIKGHGAYKNRKKWRVRDRLDSRKDNFTVVMDRSFVKQSKYDGSMAIFKEICHNGEYCETKIIQHGGAAMNACWVLENAPSCYIKYPKHQEGGGSLWDFAATACIFLEIGAYVTDINGKSLDLNRLDSTFMNHTGVIYASNKELGEEICSSIKNTFTLP